MELSTTAIQIVNLLLSALVMAVIPAFILWIAPLAARHIGVQWTALWRQLRSGVPKLIAAVDEPTDPLIKEINELSPLAAELVHQFMPKLFDLVRDELDKLANVPQSEGVPK